MKSEIATNLFKWLTKLAGRLKLLRKKVNSKSILFPTAIKELETCKAEISSLYDYISQHQPDLSEFYYPFSDIEATVREIDEKIHDWRDYQRQPRWKKIVNAIIRLVNLIITIINPPRFPELPHGKSLKQLKP